MPWPVCVFVFWSASRFTFTAADRVTQAQCQSLTISLSILIYAQVTTFSAYTGHLYILALHELNML